MLNISYLPVPRLPQQRLAIAARDAPVDHCLAQPYGSPQVLPQTRAVRVRSRRGDRSHDLRPPVRPKLGCSRSIEGNCSICEK